MEKWKVELVKVGHKLAEVNIQSGIFMSPSLSPKLLVTAMLTHNFVLRKYTRSFKLIKPQEKIMCYAHNEECERTRKGIELQNHEALDYLEGRISTSIRECLKLTPSNEWGWKKYKKIIPQKIEKVYWDEAPKQKSHQRDKHLGNPTWRILETILKMDNGRTQINGAKETWWRYTQFYT